MARSLEEFDLGLMKKVPVGERVVGVMALMERRLLTMDQRDGE